jgi:hypothetical protein
VNEEFWDCARELAGCMRDVKADPDLPGGANEEGEDDLATVALAALIFHLRRQSTGYGKAEA